MSSLSRTNGSIGEQPLDGRHVAAASTIALPQQAPEAAPPRDDAVELL